MKIYTNPAPAQVAPETGIGQVVLSLANALERIGHELTGNADQAQIITCHAAAQPPAPYQVDVLHCHGLYWSDVAGAQYGRWHTSVNRKIAALARQAIAITVPSSWVAEVFRRDMRINPIILPHGIDASQWKVGENQGYVLWNKNRNQDVCDPTPAIELAKRGLPICATFGARNGDSGPARIIGPQSFSAMRSYVQNADVYLATTLETFGVGTLEALAAGVPVLGYNWGGTSDIVEHLKTGFLVEPGDLDGLEDGYAYIQKNRAEMSVMAQQAAKRYSWDEIARRYSSVYEETLSEKQRPKRVSIIITNHNYGQWVGEAVKSAKRQKRKADEIIVVDDGSTDDSLRVLEKIEGIQVIAQKNAGVAAARNNGIAASTGDYITCLDADDRISPDFVKELASALEANRALGIAYGGLITMDEAGNMGAAPSSFPPSFSWEAQSTGGVPPSNCVPSACMFRRTMWQRAGGYKQVYAPAEDAEFWTRGLSIGFEAIKATEKPIMEYRLHGNSASRTRKYRSIADWHPWIGDKDFPFAAPIDEQRAMRVRSYVQPAVSVIIPVGPTHGIRVFAALTSVAGQTFRDWELILVDDGGLDEENERTIRTIYPFIKMRKTANPGSGAGAARNVGIQAARAPVCVFLDADDFLSPDALERMAEKFAESEGRYVYTHYAIVAEGEREGRICKPYSAEDMLRNPREHGHCITVMIATWQARRLRFDESMKILEDAEFFMRAASMGYHGVLLPEALLNVRAQYSTHRITAEVSDRIESELKKKFEKFTGEKPMASCCSGSQAAKALQEFKNRMNAHYLDAPQEQQKPSPSGEPMFYRVEYIGENTGPIQFRAPSGQVLLGANTPKYKYYDVVQSDAEALAATGRWRIFSSPRLATAQPPAAPVVEARPAQAAPTAEKLQRNAMERLIEAKQQQEEIMRKAEQEMTAAMQEETKAAPKPRRKKAA